VTVKSPPLEAPKSSPLSADDGSSARSSRLALALALAALAAALVGAIGPAEKVRTTYEWPPHRSLHEAAPRLWYTPLILIRHVPASLTAELPCARSRPLRAAGRPLMIAATARDPRASAGLAVYEQGRQLVITVGDERIARAPLAAIRETQCVYRLRLANGRWSLVGGPNSVKSGGALAAMPTVTGLFSAVDFRVEHLPRMAITTAVHATRSSHRQQLAWALGGICLSLALLLVSLDRRRSFVGVLRSTVSRARRAVGAVDAFVVLALLAWWILSPASWDDGWVVARQRNYDVSGGFSNYYDALGVNLPNGYWLDWVQHWLAGSSSVLVLRLPALAFLITSWIVCRWILSRVAIEERSKATALVMAIAFLAGSTAWLMTLRPEPVVMFLATSVLACVIAFSLHPSTRSLAVIALLVPLAFSAHHAGLVALAPVLVVPRRLWRWTTTHRTHAFVLLSASLSLLIVLASAGADLEQRVSDARLTAHAGTSTQAAAWFDELFRYRRLLAGSGLEIAFLALVFLTILGLIFRRGKSDLVFAVSTRAVAAALLLLAFAPTKQPEHVGALVGMTAVAIAGESNRLSRFAPFARRLAAQPFVIIAVSIVGLMYAFVAFAITWSKSDDRSAESEAIGRRSLEAAEWLQLTAPLLPLALLLLVVLVTRHRQRGEGGFYSASWRVASWSAPIIVVPTLAFALAVAVTGAVTVSSWTLPRQNLQLASSRACGLGDSTLVRPRRGDRAISVAALIRNRKTLVMPNLVLYFPCARLPSIKNGIADPPDYIIAPAVPASPRQPISVRYTSSPFYGLLDLFGVRTMPRRDTRKTFVVFAVRRQVPGGLELTPASS
jgi:Mycobacterial cell wall arabinan synthesis protein/Arabinosyltransferase concanavalin like domain